LQTMQFFDKKIKAGEGKISTVETLAYDACTLNL